MINFTLNGQAVQTDADPSTPLLWVVRDHFKLEMVAHHPQERGAGVRVGLDRLSVQREVDHP